MMTKTNRFLTMLLCVSALTAIQTQANEFAFKLYEQLSQTEGNLFFSPASIEAALAMTQDGAKGPTRDQFDSLLPQQVGFPAIGDAVILESANAIWADQTFPIHEPFKTMIQEKHGAEINAADFVEQPDTERLKINDWVEQKTREKIQNLLPDGSVNSETRLLLVNAIYFKGDWFEAFDPKLTLTAPFHTLSQGLVDVQMMSLKETELNYYEDSNSQIIELPYQGGEVSMLIILPRDNDGLVDIEDCLISGNLTACTTNMHMQEVRVFLPRFKVESSVTSLRKNLVALGLTDAFDAQRANFSGISETPLFISDVVHKAFVEVNEEGTEAAAATGIIMKLTSIQMDPPKQFRADHPFLFLIRENQSGKVLFIGRTCNPSK